MPNYLIVRIGSNRSNQPGRDRMPVALVDAPNREAAVACTSSGSVHAPATLDLNPEVTVWGNQRLEAIPSSKARVADLREVDENARMAGG